MVRHKRVKNNTQRGMSKRRINFKKSMTLEQKIEQKKKREEDKARTKADVLAKKAASTKAK